MKLNSIDAIRKARQPKTATIGSDEFCYLPMTVAESKRLIAVASEEDFEVVAEILAKILVDEKGKQIFESQEQLAENMTFDMTLQMVDAMFGVGVKKPKRKKRK